jgi:hypothetical protein
MAPCLHSDHRLLGAQYNGAQSVLFLLMAFQGASLVMFFPEAGFPTYGLTLSLNNSAFAPGLGGLLGVPGPLGTFILPVPFLTTVGSFISP